MKIYKIVAVLAVVGLMSLATYRTMDYNKQKPRQCTVIGKLLVDGGRHVAYPTLGLKMNDGTTFDITVTVARYSQFNVGDNLVIDKSEREIHHDFWKEAFSLITFLISGICFSFVGLYFLVGAFTFYNQDFREAEFSWED
jgi:hypothetical protein